MSLDVETQVEQQVFAALVGISQPKVSQLLSAGVLPREGTCGEWLLAYCERLREQAAGRGEELTAERAALAKSQRIGQDIKNQVAQGDYAPIGLLTDVLAAVSASIVDRFDALPAELRQTFPELPEGLRTQLDHFFAATRNEWVRGTRALAVSTVEQLTGDDAAPDAGDDDFDDDQPV